MKHLFLNLKRFDVPTTMGGVNSIAPICSWGEYIVSSTQTALMSHADPEVEYVQFFPEAHILSAAAAKCGGSPIKLGCQGVATADVALGGNFGAFTTMLPAAAAKAIGCEYALIGHCEERANKAEILSEAGVVSPEAINRILNKELLAAQGRDMKVLYCIGEQAEEQAHWCDVLRMQLEVGLAGVDMSRVVIGYEPVWSIGPGKKPADKEYITMVARYIKELTGGADVVYGGGLKTENASMIASIPEIDGGLIALTRFSGQIGFYPEEYLEITELYLGK